MENKTNYSRTMIAKIYAKNINQTIKENNKTSVKIIKHKMSTTNTNKTTNINI